MHMSGMLSQFVLIVAINIATCLPAAYEVDQDVAVAPERLVQPPVHQSSVQCSVTYAVIWDTEYVEEPVQTCETVYESQCHVTSQRLCQNTTREECHLVQDKVCNTVYQEVCRDEYKTVLEPYTETECVTLYKEDCEYHWEILGQEKVWAPIPGTCKKNPYDECHDVAKTHSKQVTYQVCDKVPSQQCHHVNRQECYQVPDQVCKSEPITQCSQVPKEICHVTHKRVPVRVSKKVPKKVCNVHGQHPAEFVPVPAVPVPVLPDQVPVVSAPVPAVPVTTQAPSTLDDILNRNDGTNVEISFGEDNSVAETNNVQLSDKFVFEEDNSKNNNSTIKFE